MKIIAGHRPKSEHIPYTAGNFQGTKYSWFSNIETLRGYNIFVVGVWLEFALQVKVGKVASFVGKIFVVIPTTTKTKIFCPTKITLYTVACFAIHCTA